MLPFLNSFNSLLTSLGKILVASNSLHLQRVVSGRHIKQEVVGKTVTQRQLSEFKPQILNFLSCPLRYSFLSSFPPYCPSLPSAFITLWQGTIMEILFFPTAVPTAWFDILGMFRSFAIIAAMSPYETVSPYGMSLTCSQTRFWKSVPSSMIGISKSGIVPLK